MRVLETQEGLSRQVVVTARLHGLATLANAGQREGMVADSTDVMLGLPHAPASYTCARVERIDDAPTEQVVWRDAWLGQCGRLIRRGLARSLKRGPAGRNLAAGVIDRSN
jgi:hypothetical protein